MLGSNIEDTAQILVPVKDTINHGNVARFQYHSDKYGFHMTQAFDLNPGEEVLLTYDDGVSKYNSTLRKYHCTPVGHGVSANIKFVSPSRVRLFLP